MIASKIVLLDNLGNICLKNEKTMIIGNYGDGNIGDEAILDVLVSELVNLGIKDIVVPSRNPKKLNALHCNSFKSISMNSTIKEFIFSNSLVIGGGGIFSAYSGPFVYASLILGTAGKIFLGKKLIFYSIGFSSTTPLFLRLLCKISMNLADHVSVRDNQSLQNLKTLQIRKNIHAVPDLALKLKPEETNVNVLIQKEGIDEEKLLVGISLNYTNDNIINKKIIDVFSEVADWLIDNFNAQLIFFTFCPSFVSHSPDNELAKIIKNSVKDKKKPQNNNVL